MLKSSFVLSLFIIGHINSFAKIHKFELLAQSKTAYNSILQFASHKDSKKTVSFIFTKEISAFVRGNKKSKVKNKKLFFGEVSEFFKFYLLKNPAIFDFNKFRQMLFGCCMMCMA